MLSVVIPIYKTEKFLKRCINSILNQTLNDIEIILVDDGSPDDCPQICDEYASRYKRIKVIHKKNEGLGMARNSGIGSSSGEYITFIDSDDYIEPTYLEDLYNLAVNNNVDVCVSGGIYIDDGKKVSVRYCVSPELHNKCIEDLQEIKKFSAKVVSPNKYGKDYCSLSSCFSLFRRSLFTEKGLAFVSEKSFLSEDMEFNMKLYQECNSVYLSNIIGYHYWYNDNSLSRGNKKNRFELLIATMSILEKKLKEYRIENEEDRIAFYYWVNFEKCVNQEVRYNKLRDFTNIQQNIQKMLSDDMSIRYLNIISRNFALPKSQKLLCYMMKKKHVKNIIITLKIYNFLKH